MAENQPKLKNKHEIRLEVGQRVKDFYTQRGLKRKKFSESIGWAYDTVRSYEEGRAEPGSDFYKKLIEVYPDADVLYIMTGATSETLSELKEMKFKEIPILHHVKAGNPILGFSDLETIGMMFTMNTKDKDVFGLRVEGNSMEPEISEGDLVVCAPLKPFVSGKIYVVVTDESEATIKQVWRKERGYELVARNPEFPTIHLPDEKVIRLIRVVEITRRYG